MGTMSTTLTYFNGLEKICLSSIMYRESKTDLITEQIYGKDVDIGDLG